MVRTRLLLVLVFAWSFPLFGQQVYWPDFGQYHATGFGGGSVGGSFQFSTNVTGSSVETNRAVGMRYANGYQLGASVGEKLDDFWGAELEYTFANQPLRFTNLSPTIQSLALSHLVHRLTYNISFAPPMSTKRFRPYGKAGIGTALFYITGDSKEEALQSGLRLRDSWEVALNAGGGFKYLLTDIAAFTFDVRDQMSPVPSYGLPRSASVINGQFQPGFAHKGWFNSWQFGVGIAFQWDE
jgi:outer membrane protein W